MYDRLNGCMICSGCGYVFPSLLNVAHTYTLQEEVKRVDAGRINALRKKQKVSYETAKELYEKEIRAHIELLRNVLPFIREIDVKTAEALLRKYLCKVKSIKKRWKKEVLALALLILSMKLNNAQLITIKKIKKNLVSSNIPLRDVKKAYKHIVKALAIKVPLRQQEEEMEILTKLRRKYGINYTVESLIKSLKEKVVYEKLYVGRGRRVICAAIGYIAYKLLEYNITQKEVANLAEITEIPLREAIKKILRTSHIEVFA